MGISDVPTEIIDSIISYLWCNWFDRSSEYEYLASARLVCRKWDVIAKQHLFRTIELKPTEYGLKKWDFLINDLGSNAKSMIVHSYPNYEIPDEDSLEEEDDREDEDEDEDAVEDIDTELVRKRDRAIAMSEKLPKLDKACLTFVEHFRSDGEVSYDEYMEDIDRQYHVLDHFLQTLNKRAQTNSGLTTVRTLAFDNLQNYPDRRLSVSPVFRQIMSYVTQLHLRIAAEVDPEGIDGDLYKKESRSFMPYLETTWLVPVADHLTSLTLFVNDGWGPMPGYFNGTNLRFPSLQKLALGQYYIADDSMVDWIVRQKRLKSMHFHDCGIMAYAALDREDNEHYKIQSEQWERLGSTTLGIIWADYIYEFHGTWEAVFERIRIELPELIDFGFHPDTYDAFAIDITCDRSLYPQMKGLPERFDRRYVAFTGGPDPWEDPSELLDYGSDSSPEPNEPMDRAARTRYGDEKALLALLESTFERRR